MTSVAGSLLYSLRFLLRSRASLHPEIVARRHELAVVNRCRRPRLHLTSADRMPWARLSRIWPRWRAVVHIVKPDTVITWHRRGFRLFWTWRSRAPAVRVRHQRSARSVRYPSNPPWGAPRIHGELQKLGITVSQSTVAKHPRRPSRPPSQTWRTVVDSRRESSKNADPHRVPLTSAVVEILEHRASEDPHSTYGNSVGQITEHNRNQSKKGVR